MASYLYVTGATEAPEVITKDFQIKQYLHWIGFGTDSMKYNIYEYLISSFINLLTVNFDDANTMAKDYMNRTLILGKLNFGICRIKKLRALLRWEQNFCCISEQPSIEGMMGDYFLIQLNRALEQTKVWK